MPTTGLHCEIAESFEALQLLSESWQKLWAADRGAVPFQTFSWATAWWQCYGRALQVFSPVVYDGSEVVAILPLVKHGRVLSFLGTPEADYADILCAESRTVGALDLILRTLLEQHRKWDRAALHHLDANSRIASHWHELPHALQRHLQLVPSNCSSKIQVDSAQACSRLHMLAQGRHLREKQRRLEKLGRLQFRHVESWLEAQQHLERFFHQQIQGRLLSHKSSACQDARFRNFIRALGDRLDLSSQMRLGVLEVGGRVVAWNIGFETSNKLFLYQQTFDAAHGNCSPGEVLLRNLLTYAAARTSPELDFGLGDEHFKSRFANRITEVFTLYIEPSRWSFVRRWWREVHGQGQLLLRAGKRKAGTHPHLWRLVRRSRLLFAAALGRSGSWKVQPGNDRDTCPELQGTAITAARDAANMLICFNCTSQICVTGGTARWELPA